MHVAESHLSILFIADNFRSVAAPILGEGSGRCWKAMGTTINSVEIWDCDDSQDSQMWVRPSAGSMQLSPLSAPTMCLDLKDNATNNNNDVVLAPCDAGSSSQKWFLDELDRLENSKGLTQCVAVNNGATGNGNKLVLFTCLDGSNFKWYTAACKCYTEGSYEAA